MDLEIRDLSDTLSLNGTRGSDTESLPPLSSEEPSDLPWLPETDDSRWVEFASEEQADQWGSGQTSAAPTEFDPASAFEPSSSADNGSQMERDAQIWGSSASESEQKRRRLNDGSYRQSITTSIHSLDSLGPSRPERDSLDGGYGVSKAEEVGVDDDDERSSKDYQGHDFEDSEDDVVRALGAENVRRLASMPDGEAFPDLEESSSVQSPRAPSSSSQCSSEISSDDLPHGSYCINCTSSLSPGQAHCLDCGHDANVHPATSAVRLSIEQSINDQPTVLAYDDMMLEHEEGKRHPHPERPDRIKAIMSRLTASGLSNKCTRISCREATEAELAACHTKRHIQSVAAKAAEAQASGEEIGVPRVYFSMDTYVRPSTFRCASLSAGGAIDATLAVARGDCRNAAAIIRPPGHHAESNMAMGFCFFNNAAVAARAALRNGMNRVMILDWDVHHGNGTQHIFEDDDSVLFVSLHRYDGGHFFPGTGGPNEVGRGPGAGKTVNIPWPCGGMGNGDYLAAFHRVVMPIAYEFAPDLIIISAGFDAADGDPLGGCRVTPEGYAHMAAMLKSVAPCCALLEGGYNLEVTAAGTEATLRVLMGETPPPLPHAGRVSLMAAQAIQSTIRKQAHYWRCLRPFVEHPNFDPYVSAFQSGSKVFEEAHSPRSQLDQQDGLDFRGVDPSSDVAFTNSKLRAVRQQGKSQRRVALMHALHLVAIKHRMKATKEVSRKLLQSPGIQAQRARQALMTGPSPVSPTMKRLLSSQANGLLREEDPFMTQDSDSDNKNALDVSL